ncbi:hypothetical protein [Desulfosoma sp.]
MMENRLGTKPSKKKAKMKACSRFCNRGMIKKAQEAVLDVLL